jgi:hypothetical protein
VCDGIEARNHEPVFAPPKRGGIRSLDLSDETVALLREHEKQQSEVKMANRLRYRDHGLMFAGELDVEANGARRSSGTRQCE